MGYYDDFFTKTSMSDIDNMIANSKTNIDSREDDYFDKRSQSYEKAREEFEEAEQKGYPILSYWQQADGENNPEGLKCDECEFGTENMKGPDDDSGNVICKKPGNRCPGVWHKTIGGKIVYDLQGKGYSSKYASDNNW